MQVALGYNHSFLSLLQSFVTNSDGEHSIRS